MELELCTDTAFHFNKIKHILKKSIISPIFTYLDNSNYNIKIKIHKSDCHEIQKFINDISLYRTKISTHTKNQIPDINFVKRGLAIIFRQYLSTEIKDITHNIIQSVDGYITTFYPISMNNDYIYRNKYEISNLSRLFCNRLITEYICIGERNVTMQAAKETDFDLTTLIICNDIIFVDKNVKPDNIENLEAMIRKIRIDHSCKNAEEKV